MTCVQKWQRDRGNIVTLIQVQIPHSALVLFWSTLYLSLSEGYCKWIQCSWNSRSSHPEVSLGKGVLKIWSKFTGEDPCRSVISIKLQINFIEIIFRHACSRVNLQAAFFKTPFLKNTSGWLLWNLFCHNHMWWMCFRTMFILFKCFPAFWRSLMVIHLVGMQNFSKN